MSGATRIIGMTAKAPLTTKQILEERREASTTRKLREVVTTEATTGIVATSATKPSILKLLSLLPLLT